MLELFAPSGGRDAKTSATSPRAWAWALVLALGANEPPGGISTSLFLYKATSWKVTLHKVYLCKVTSHKVIPHKVTLCGLNLTSHSHFAQSHFPYFVWVEFHLKVTSRKNTWHKVTVHRLNLTSRKVHARSLYTKWPYVRWWATNVIIHSLIFTFSLSTTQRMGVITSILLRITHYLPTLTMAHAS